MKEFRIPDSYELISREPVDELDSIGVLLTHKRTKARIALLLNDDENKVFCIGFRTPPKDSSGVAHIIEHTVLCGSRDFPLKDPFVELIKGSLNTFLNAMTYTDKTVYPLASCNDTDFRNLMHVYLDAVFYPNIYRDRRIFMQEGWHYERDEESGELSVNGVVYNEMKGDLSAPEEVLSEEVRALMFPDSEYGNNYGGDPEGIRKLTYEQYLGFHRRYYHPSNSYIYLYGDIDVYERLDWMDKAYLSAFDYKEIDSMPRLQKPFASPVTAVKPYAVMPGQAKTEGSYLTCSFCMGEGLSAADYIAMDVLDYSLCSAPGAVLRQAILDAGLAQDVYAASNASMRQPLFSVVARGAREEDLQAFASLVRGTLEAVVRDGFDKDTLRAGLNRQEFSFREGDYGRIPKGLLYGLWSLDSWLYDDGRPFLHLRVGDVFGELWKSIEGDYFERLVQRLFLDNPHCGLLALCPREGLTKERDEALRGELRALAGSMTPAELAQIEADAEALKQWQETPDSDELKRKIPLLSRADLKRKEDPFIYKLHEEQDLRILHSEVPTSGVCYIALLFDMERVPAELFPYLGILSSVLGKTDTALHGYAALANERNIHTGGLSASLSFFMGQDDPERFVRAFMLMFKVRPEKLEKGFSLAGEILTTSDFSDLKHLKELLDEMHAAMKDDMNGSGHLIAAMRALSHLNVYTGVSEAVNGITALRLLERYDGTDAVSLRRRGKLAKALQRLTKVLFRRENLLIHVTGSAEMLDEVKKLAPHFADGLFTEAVAEGSFLPVPEKKNEAFRTAGTVQYVCRAGNFRQAKLPYTGRLHLLRSILSTDYLWNNVRVKGGAYGCMCMFSRTGSSYMVSYRDPHLQNTIDIFAGAEEYIRTFEADERTMTQYIIGAVAGLDVPKTPSMKGSLGLSAFLCGYSDEEFQKNREELLDATAEDVRALHVYVKALMDAETLCVLGAAEKIEENAGLFDSVETLFAESDAPDAEAGDA